jgi:uroporphyrinogen-III decarboxylase
MMDYQLKKIERHYEYYKDDCYLGFLIPWYGTAVLASGFGHPVVMGNNQDPAADVSKVVNPQEIKNFKLPDSRKDGLMPKVISTLKYFCDHSDIAVGITDCQGPLTTALTLIGYDNFFYWMFDHPFKIHELMDLVTDALIRWIKTQKEQAQIPFKRDSYVHGVRLPDGYGGGWFSDDDAAMLSPEQYKEFVLPYNSRVLDAFNGGCIHFCGNANHHIENLLALKRLTAVNNFMLDNIAEAQKMKHALCRKGIVYEACDFALSNDRIESYYKDLFDAMGDQKGMVVVSVVVPAIQLERGNYSACHRNQFELGKRVRGAIYKALQARHT